MVFGIKNQTASEKTEPLYIIASNYIETSVA